MRNSSLVEGSCADNITGLKPAAEAVDSDKRKRIGMVGERPACSEALMEIGVERAEVRIPV